MKFLKKTIVFLLVVCFFLETQPAQAQKASDLTASDLSAEQWLNGIRQYTEGDINQHIHDKFTINNFGFTFTDAVVDLEQALAISYNPSNIPRTSVIGLLNKNIVAMYKHKPADAQLYLADIAGKAGVIKPAFAQGIGFSGLSPLLGLWKAFRNIAYGFLIIIMVIIGFMILFRMKIDPRTVISIQNAIPRIVVTLILITFSYAIAGIMIDFMYLCLYVTLIAFSTAGGGNVPGLTISGAMGAITGLPLNDLFGSAWSAGPAAITGLVNLIGRGTADTIGAVVLTALGGFVGATFGGAIGAGIGSVGVLGGGIVGQGSTGNALAWLIVSLALLFAIVRIAVTLLSAYIQIILGVIFGPLQLMFGAIPNVDAFSSWIRNLTANLGVFVVTSIMLLLASILSAQATQVANSNLWVPPGLGGQQGAAASGLISFGMVLSIPSMAAALKEMLKAKGTLPVGSSLSTALTSPFSTGMQLISTGYYIKGFTPQKVKDLLGIKNPKP